MFSKESAQSATVPSLTEPEKMAEYLLRDNPEWTPDKIEEAMNRDQPQTVRLNKPVPVLITYYTAWVDENGLLNFRDDIYSHDKDLSIRCIIIKAPCPPKGGTASNPQPLKGIKNNVQLIAYLLAHWHIGILAHFTLNPIKENKI